ncbi:MAG: PIN domain-containing protein [Chitinispirillales bacterium]|jgi:predicted nucleic acid-binding protein|nr:PIN domain-containing protein [Chitinispirillales bacterium]
MNRKLIIYLDTCCYSRLFDGKTSPEVIAEAERVRYIMSNRFSGEYRIIGSFVVVTEIIQNPDAKERRIIERLYNRIISGEAPRTAQRRTRAAELETKGLKTMDARHLAAAEAAGADYLLTVDKDFLKKASKPKFTTVKVINPIYF